MISKNFRTICSKVGLPVQNIQLRKSVVPTMSYHFEKIQKMHFQVNCERLPRFVLHVAKWFSLVIL